MDLLMIEVVLWVGLLFLFWALKDGLGRVESDLESLGLLNSSRRAGEAIRHYAQPDQLLEPIGSYKDEPIYRYAYINGLRYQFDRVRPAETAGTLNEEERYLQPGLVYVRCDPV
jgi:hypothetical protein